MCQQACACPLCVSSGRQFGADYARWFDRDFGGGGRASPGEFEFEDMRRMVCVLRFFCFRGGVVALVVGLS